MRGVAWVLWTCAILLSLVGVTAAISRWTSVREMRATRTSISAMDNWQLTLLAGIRGGPGSPADVDARLGTAKFATKFAAHPVLSFLHLIPGALLLILMPLQFVRRIRNGYRAYHRWAGRMILVGMFGVVISAIYFGLFNPHVPLLEPPIIVIAAVLLVFCATRGFLAIRSGDIRSHREWMIRTYATAAAIATQRILALPLSLVFPTMSLDLLFVITIWACWPVTLGLVEVWIRRSREFAVVP